MATNPIRNIPALKTYATATVTTETDGLSDVIDIGGHALRSVEMSTTWTAATLTFMGSVSSTTAMASIRTTTAGTELTYATTSGYMLSIDPIFTAGLRFIQIRSGTTAAPVAQAVARTIRLGLAAVDHPN